MNENLLFDPETGRLSMRGELTIYQAREAADLLRAAFQSGKLRHLDLGGVTELDTAGLQLLMVAAGLESASGEPVEVLASSEVVLQTLSFAGVTLGPRQTDGTELSR